MSEQPNRQKKVKLPSLTPEQQATVLAAREKALADAKAERERVELYGKNVEKMSHKQLRGELHRTIKREHFKEGVKRVPIAGEPIMVATILLAVLDSTRTSPLLDDGRRLRKDQLNPASTKTMNPGW